MTVKGSVQEKNGVLYTVVSYKKTNGKWEYKWKSTKLQAKGNKKRAEQLLAEEIEKYQSVGEDISKAEVLFSNFIDFWLSVQKDKIQITTYDGYSHMIKKHIYPYFNERMITLKSLSAIDIQNYYNKKAKEGLSSNTIIKHHAIIRSALQYAIKTKILKENVADFVEKPKKEEREAKFYTKKELGQLFDVIKEEKIEIAILLAAYLGLRRSEVLGVKWSNVDFEDRTIKIHHKVVRTFDDEGKISISKQNKMKNTKSYRIMPIPDILARKLKQIQIKQKENRLLFGKTYTSEFLDYVCVDEMGELLKPDYITKRFSKIIKKHNLKPLNFHGLRHSCATLLLSLNYQMKDIQEYLGHSNYELTAKTYAHVDLQRKNAMSDELSLVFNF